MAKTFNSLPFSLAFFFFLFSAWQAKVHTSLHLPGCTIPCRQVHSEQQEDEYILLDVIIMNFMFHIQNMSFHVLNMSFFCPLLTGFASSYAIIEKEPYLPYKIAHIYLSGLSFSLCMAREKILEN